MNCLTREYTLWIIRIILKLLCFFRFLETNELAADPCFVYLFSVLNDLENGKISDILKHLQHAVKSIAPCGISLQNSCIRRVTAIMHEPTGSSDNPIRFTTGLTVTIPVHATFENVQNADCIRLKVHAFCCPYICLHGSI